MVEAGQRTCDGLGAEEEAAEDEAAEEEAEEESRPRTRTRRTVSPSAQAENVVDLVKELTLDEVVA